MLRSAGGQPDVLPGAWPASSLPAASTCPRMFAWVTDRPGGAGYMTSDGSSWLSISKRVETYSGTTNGSGDYTVVFSPAFSATPNVQPVTYPSADSVTRVRVTAADQNGFTIRAEKNITVNLLAVDLLSLGVAGVASVPVRVLVVEN